MDHSAYDAGYAVGRIAGFLLIYGGILALGIFAGKWLARRRETGFVRWPLYLAAALVLLLLLGQCAGRSEARAMPSVASPA